MELRTYTRLLLQGWWLILGAVLVAITASLMITYSQTPIYRTTATFVVSPGASFSTLNDILRGWDSLTGREGAMATYVEVAKSNAVLGAVYEEMGISGAHLDNFKVYSEMIPSTNIIRIMVESDDPLLAKTGADLVGLKTTGFIRNLSEVYDMKPLDAAYVPEAPSKPDRTQNLAMATILGLVVGVGSSLLINYFRSPSGTIASMSIIDMDTGVFNKQYFSQRLGEEMSRAKRNRYPLALALMNVDHPGVLRSSLPPELRSEALRKVIVFLKQYLREEDVMARLDGTTFAFLLPDMHGETAVSSMEKLQSRLAWTAFDVEKMGVKLNLTSATGVVAYNSNGTGQAELLDMAHYALKEAEAAGYGKVRLFNNGDSTGIQQNEPSTEKTS